MKLLALIAIISTISMVSATIMQEANANPKEYKYNYHGKSTYDPETGEYEYKDGYNANGPSGHTNCKSSYDSDDGYDYRCKSN